MAGSDAALRMADRLAGGALSTDLTRYRQAGVAWAAIARLLDEQYGIIVSADQLPIWADKLGVDVTAVAS